MTYILGLNAYHADAAACLVKDGTLVAAVEEERFRRIKHWGGFPGEAIRYCLSEAGIALSEAENSLERLLTEPRHDMATEEYALQLITYGRRAAGALTTIDTYSARDLTSEVALGAPLARAVETYVVTTLHQAAAFARGAQPEADAPVPELPTELDARLRATLARLLRGARLVADISRGGLDRVAG